MSAKSGTSKLGAIKKDDRSSRYASRVSALEKGKRSNPSKEVTSSQKSCNCLVKSDGWKGSKVSQNSKLPLKKTNMKCVVKDGRRKSAMANHREKVVIVSKRSSSVSVVKSCKLRKSVSVKKVSYSTSVVLSSDEEDSDSEEESEEEDKKECLKKKKTILKHTTSKVKSSVRDSKKVKNKSMNKDKAIKLLCDKLSSGGKHKGSPSRELRPRFPYPAAYNMIEDWPTARTHRMASLNALAKVHVLYENEGRVVGENLQEADETSLIDFLNENSDEDLDIKKDLKPLVLSNQKKSEKIKPTEEKPKNLKKDSNAKKEVVSAKSKIVRRGKKRKSPDIEIIDTKVCKRMASLNAQAILAASFQLEPKLKRSYKRSDKCYNSSDTETEIDLSIIKQEKDDSEDEVIETPKLIVPKCDRYKIEDDKSQPKEKSTAESATSKKASKADTTGKKSLKASEVTIIESGTSAVSNRSCTVASTAATTKVGMTQYTEVTKVQINTHKDSEIKEERKSERKIEHIVSNEDVAITQMYHYQSKTSNESYCVQMQTTYKPGSKTLTAATNLPPNSDVRPYTSEASSPNTSNFYGHSSMLPSQVYPNVGPVPTMGIDQRLPRHYGASAFSVPRFKQSQVQFPSNEYGYYQPAGPLIQPIQEQVIHKPVPFHPQPNRHQAPQRPLPSSLKSFEPRPSQQSKLPVPLPTSPQQKSLVPIPARSESQSQSQTSSQPPRPQDEPRNRNLSSNNVSNAPFQQPPKHVRSPVMPTLYSSQNNFRGYQTQKRTPNSFGSYSQPYESKINSPKLVGYESRKETSAKLVGYNPTVHSTNSKSSSQELSRSGFQPSKDVPHKSSNSHPGCHFNINDTVSKKQKIWDHKTTHGMPTNYNSSQSSSMCNPGTSLSACNPGSPSMYNDCRTPSSICNPETSANFSPYHSNFKKDVQRSNLDVDGYPPRPPSVITLDEDSPRDTKTYIQLEVPKNSHREMIVVVDVEDDEGQVNSNLSITNATVVSSQDSREKNTSRLQRQATVPNLMFDKPDNKYTHSKNDEMHKMTGDPSRSIDKKHMHSKYSDIPNSPLARHQDKTEKKQKHPRSSDLPKTTFDRPQNKIDKQMYSKNSDMPKAVFDRPQSKIEKQKFSKNSDMSKAAYNRSQNEIERKHSHLITSDIHKTTFDNTQDNLEKKPTHTKHSDLSKNAFDKPSQNKIESKYDHPRDSDVSMGSPQNEEKFPERNSNHLADLDKTESTFDTAQNEIIPDISIVKIEKISDENEANTNSSNDRNIPLESRNCDEKKIDSTDGMCIDAKKKKESAVVRRAKMHGKQRTFRDCYNRPLAQKKNDEGLIISDQHMAKEFQPLVSLPRLVLPKLEKPPAHGWSWEGTPQDKLVYISNDDPPCLRRCFPSIRHVEGDVISVRDCVFLRSGPRKTDLPFVAKVTALWETPSNGEMTMSMLWYYRPEHTETGKKFQTSEDEILASRHRDINSVACIEDKCYVLTYSEYCRYRKRLLVLEDSSTSLDSPVPENEEYQSKKLLPPINVSPDLVLFCRRVYDHRQKRLLKNPTV